MLKSADAFEQALDSQFPYREIGLVDEVVGLIIESKGPQGKIGDVCEIRNPCGDTSPILAEVVGFKSGKLQLMPLGEQAAIATGWYVVNTNQPFQINVGDALLGRVINGLGEPIDNRLAPACTGVKRVDTTPPSPLERPPIDEILPLGVKALDGFTTIGKGQRVGIFSGSGVGKSTLLGMMARNTEADLNVIALIGERGREVKEFVDHVLGEEGLKRSIVVVATSEQPALMKIKAALVATTIAEHFRDQGKDVLLMMDSLTRVAMALREVGLSVGEPPTSRGYTPSVFAFMPKLLERSGTSAHGSITGLYNVLVEGDDFNEPISDAVRGILDGHIMLSRELAHQNHFPAVDVLSSISRLMFNIADADHQQSVGMLKDLMATYKQSEDIISIGAYVRGANRKLDQAVAMKEHVDAFLKQDVSDKVTLMETVSAIHKLGGMVNV